MIRKLFAAGIVVALLAISGGVVYFTMAANDEWAIQRQKMLEAVEQDVIRTAPFTRRTELDSNVIDAMRRVPRHKFVPDVVEIFAYLNKPLPIGSSQTISQPFIVALMTDVIGPKKHHNVLEVGTGSGYQAAVLSELVAQVHSIEIIPELAESARNRLQTYGYKNVHVYTGDGWGGNPENAPYDGIIVTAAIETVPAPLLEQLKLGGKMVIPIGQDQGVQELILFEKTEDGAIQQQSILPVKFVPFSGSQGHEDVAN